MKSKNEPKIIMLSGGGTGGSVTPLLALANYLKSDYDFIFVGTNFGPEKALVESAQILFLPIMSGKWRRYFSWQNFIDVFKIIGAFFQSFSLLHKYHPDLLMSAGGFVSVPLAYAARLLRIPVLVHQQDVRAGLANKLMAKVASRVTVTFEKSLRDYGAKALWVGNPVPDESFSQIDLWTKYNLNPKRPLLLVLGGGTGSAFINGLVSNSLDQLLAFCQIVHIAGAGKMAGLSPQNNYRPLEFIGHDELLWFMNESQVIVSRCGLGILTEISSLGRAAILIPMPNSHQEDNAAIFADQKAAIVLAEENLTPTIFISQVQELMENKKLHNDLRSFVTGIIRPANASLKEVINDLV